MVRFSFIFLSFFLTTSLLSQEFKKVSIQLQWLDQFQFAGYYIAKEKGFYKDAGLEVEIKKFDYDICPVDEVISKRATFGVGRSSLLINKGNGKDIVLLNAIFQSSPLMLLSTKDSKINSIKDFKGKRVMFTCDVAECADIYAMTNMYGIKLDDLNILKHSFNVNDLIHNKTDLMASYVSNEPYLLEQKGIEYTVFHPKDHGFDFYSDFIFTSNDEMQNNHEMVENFTKASLKGWEYAFEHMEETADLILAKYNVQNKTKEALLFEAKKLKELAYYKTDTLGRIDVNKLKRTYDIYNVMGLLEKQYDIRSILSSCIQYNSLLNHQEREYLIRKKELKVCINPDNLPYDTFENGEHKGISSEYLRLISKKLGIPLKPVVSKNADEMVQFLKNKKCDIKATYISTNLAFPYRVTQAYLEDSLSLVTKMQHPFITDLNNHMDKKFVMYSVQRGPLLYIKKRFPNINIILADSNKEALKMVAENKVFGYIGRTIVLSYNIQKYYPSSLKIMKEFKGTNISFGVVEDDPILLSLLNKILGTLSSKDHLEIRNGWISTTVEKEPDYSFVWYIVLIITIIITAIVYKQYLLKKMNKILQKQKKDFEKFFESSPDGISILKDDKFIMCNQKLIDILKFDSKEELLNIHPSQVSPKFQPDGRESFEKAQEMIKLAANNYGHQFEWIHLKADGEEFWAEITLTPMILNNEKVIHAVWRDISDKKRNEDIIINQTKMAALGEMLGNIAHQWRQPLNIISTSVSGLKIQKELEGVLDQDISKVCDDVNNHVQYLSNTIDSFRNFIKSDLQKVEFNLADKIKSCLHLAEGTIKNSNITIIQNIDKNITLTAYPNELIQCFINIIHNSKDAFEDIEDMKLLFISTSLKDDNVIITFKDNAGGIPKNILPHIFEPYFTTKHQFIGTGLGLHMTYNLIVENMNGIIEVKNVSYKYNNKEYKGAEFIITLPL